MAEMQFFNGDFDLAAVCDLITFKATAYNGL